MDLRYVPACPQDAEDLVALRIAAMRPSLERLGRFDPARARDRFLAAFEPRQTCHIEVAGERVGCVVVKPTPAGLRLDHLYIHPLHQGRRIGAAVVGDVLAHAEAMGGEVTLSALRGSDANRFYSRLGFSVAGEEEYDIHYVRAPQGIRVALESPAQPEVLALIDALDAFQKPLYPPECHYGIDLEALSQPNVLFAVVRDAQAAAVGCGALVMQPAYGELKRMFVSPQARGQRIGHRVIAFLEAQAAARGCTLFHLETGTLQVQALALYANNGYERCGPFGDYPDDPHSVFMCKAAPAAAIKRCG